MEASHHIHATYYPNVSPVHSDKVFNYYFCIDLYFLQYMVGQFKVKEGDDLER